MNPSRNDDKTPPPDITILAMGGTIDKDYPRTTNGYAFEICQPPSAARILSVLNSSDSRGSGLTYEISSVCAKDSTDITDEDRMKLVHAIRESKSHRVIVTHGTDTLIETACFVQRSAGVEEDAHEKKKKKVVAFVGAMKPQIFKDTDADFNFGVAVGATSVFGSLGGCDDVLVCMGGNVIPCMECLRCSETGRFYRRV